MTVRRMTAGSGRLGAVLAVGLAIGVVVPRAAASPRPVDRAPVRFAADSSTACLDDEEVQFLKLINDYRQQNGLGLLEASVTLTDASDVHSLDMAATGHFDHTMSNGVGVAENLKDNGYTGTTYGENIAGGVEDAKDAFTTWQNSPEHNQNMLRGAFKAIGIARDYNADSQYGWYWTTDFGGSFDSPAKECGNSQAAADQGQSGVQNEAQQVIPGAYRTTTAATPMLGGPEADYPQLVSIPQGGVVQLTGDVKGGFLPVEYNGSRGWVDATALSPATTATTTTVVNFRAGPSYDDSVLTTIPEGDVVALDGNSTNGFVGATFSGQNGWIDSQYLTDGQANPAPDATAAPTDTGPAADAGASNAAPADTAPVATATTLADTALRSGPATADSMLATIPASTQVDLTGESGGGFVQVVVNGQTGWIDAAYLK